jgi:hypothetical protein
VDHQRVIERGLSGDERVVTKGLMKAAPGRTVKPEPQEPGGENRS